jgi:nucleoside-diphosphate-sugar epimerase
MRIDNNSRILITGGAGFIGSSFCDYLLEQGISPKNIYILDNLCTGTIHNINNNLIGQNVYNDLNELPPYKFTHIFNFAARARVQPSYKSPNLYLENVTFLSDLLEYVRLNCPQSLVYHMSSSTVITDLQSPYAYSKKMCEDLCEMYDDTYGLKIKVFRLSSVYGKKMDLSNENSLLIGKIIRSYITNEPFSINNGGESLRHYTYVDNICEFLFTVDIKEYRKLIYNIKDYMNGSRVRYFLEKIKIKSIFNNTPVKEAYNNWSDLEEYINLPKKDNVVDWLEKEITNNLKYYKDRLEFIWHGQK